MRRLGSHLSWLSLKCLLLLGYNNRESKNYTVPVRKAGPMLSFFRSFIQVINIHHQFVRDLESSSRQISELGWERVFRLGQLK